MQVTAWAVGEAPAY